MDDKKFITQEELNELERLLKDRDDLERQAPKDKKLMGPLYDVIEKSKVDFTKYIVNLSKKYNYNPMKQGVNRQTREIENLPEELTKVELRFEKPSKFKKVEKK